MVTEPRDLQQLEAENARLRRELEMYKHAEAFGSDGASPRTILSSSDPWFRHLLQNSSDVITILDSNGIETWANGPCAKIVGYEPEELIGTDSFDYVHPDQREWIKRAFRELLENPGKVQRAECRLRHKDGRWIDIECVGTNLLHEPAVRGVVLNTRDVTERNRLQEQLHQASKMNSVGEMAGGIAHDFNNMLTAIAGNTELALLESDLVHPIKLYLEEIQRATRSAASLTRQLLAFSRRRVFEPRVVNLNNLIANLRGMLTRLLGENLVLETSFEPNLGSVRVDPNQFELVIVNLAVNARDAMPGGGRLHLETANLDLEEEYCAHHARVPAGKYVVLTVSDTGMGMSPEVQQRVFEPFFTTKPTGHGTGLGLATVFGTVERAEGTIEVCSEWGVGTTFRVYVPRVAQTAQPLVSEGSPVDVPKGDGTILLVEDDAGVRDLTVAFLKRLGYRVHAAASGDEALFFAERHEGSIELIMTDIVMPRISGQEVAERVLFMFPKARVLFTSGYTENFVLGHGAVDPTTNFISKPYSLRTLAAKVRAVLHDGPNRG